ARANCHRSQPQIAETLMSTMPPSPAGHWTLSLGACRILFHKRGVFAGLGLGLALAAMAAVSLAFGAADLSPLDALRAVFGQGSPMQVFLIQELRAPRLAAGLLSGAALGVAGCLLQTLAHNRLATPGIIGIDDG